MPFSRALLAPGLAAGVLLSLLAPAAAATAAEPIDVVLYSNALYTDPSEEDAEMAAAVTAAGGVVTLFDGGDNTVATWTAALVDAEILVLPEADRGNYYLTAFGSDVATYLAAWVAAGGQIIVADFDETIPLVSAITGLDLTTAVGPLIDTATRQGGADLSALPASLQAANATVGLFFSDLTPEQLAAITPIYAEADAASVATVAVGDGLVVLLGYDWYPDDFDIAGGIRADWDAVLAHFVQLAAPAAVVEPEAPTDTAPAAPQLAATGAEAMPFLVGAAILLLAGAGTVFAARVSAQRV